jgi:lysyl-tRNA synthetase class 1
VVLQQTLPARAADLTAAQKAFLVLLGQRFPDQPLNDDQYQTFVFDTARLTPLSQKDAFAAIYRVLLDQDKGPKAGSLFAYLDREFLVRRFAEVTFDQAAFWQETGQDEATVTEWLQTHAAQIVTCSVKEITASAAASPEGVVELDVTLTDGKIHRLRVLYPDLHAAAGLREQLRQWDH